MGQVFEFDEMKAVGKAGEAVVFNYLKGLGFVCKFAGHDDGGEYTAPDLIVESHVSGTPSRLSGKRLEIKTDQQAHSTGNVVLELLSNVGTGRIGWVYSTTAEYLAHYSSGDGLLLIVPTEAVRTKLETTWHSTRTFMSRNATFTSCALLVPREGFQALAIHAATVGK